MRHRHHHRRDASTSGDMIPVHRRDLDQAHDAMYRAHSYLSSRDASKSSTKKDDGVKGRLLEAVPIGLGAAAVGLISGYKGSPNIGTSSVPWGLAAFVLGQGIDAMGWAGKYGTYFAGAANGGLAAWVSQWGGGQGQQMAANAKKAAAPPPAAAGIGACTGCSSFAGTTPGPMMMLGQGTYGQGVRPLTEAELAARAYGMR